MKRYELLQSVHREEILPQDFITMEHFLVFLDNVWVMLDEANKRYSSRTLKLSRTYLMKTILNLSEIRRREEFLKELEAEEQRNFDLQQLEDIARQREAELSSYY